MKQLIVIHPRHVGGVFYADGAEIELETMQGFVRGPIETVPTFKEGYVLVVNEEGKLMEGLEPNMRATRVMSPKIKDVLVGTALLMKVEGEELVGLDHESAQEWMMILQ